ncbi:MAG: cellulose biosynthesis protein BcsS [Hyphomicrobiaceae bacterium]
MHAEGAPQPRIIHALDNYPYHLRNEAWGGANVSMRQWSVYTGATYALTGDIERSGWRLRSTGGYGRYTYRKWQHGPNRRRSERVNVKYAGRKYFSSTLVGYQFQWHRASLKAFGGLSTERQIITPHDPDEAARVMSYGGKATLEAWLALSQRHWLATTVAWASTQNTYKLSLQTGHAIRHDLDIGIEAHLDGNNSYRAGRLGGFATWQLGGAGLRLAAGAGMDRALRTAAYGSVNLFVRY